MRKLIKKILRESVSSTLKRRILNLDIDKSVNKEKLVSFLKDMPIGVSIDKTVHNVAHDIFPSLMSYNNEDEHDLDWKNLKKSIEDKYGDYLRTYFEKRKQDIENDKTPSGTRFIFIKHDAPYYSNWRGFTEGFNSFDEMVTKYGNWIDVDWDEIRTKLEKTNGYPESTFTGYHNSRPLRISNAGDEGNTWGYNFSVIKQMPDET